jgi:rod shape determining protein RodA
MLLPLLLLVCVGLFVIYSATIHSTPEGARGLQFWEKQFLWMVLGLTALFLVSKIPLGGIFTASYGFYLLCLIPLVALLGYQHYISHGAERWFILGPLKFQPSEFAKIGTLLALARWLSTEEISYHKFRSILVPFLIVLAPMALVLKQPDLGTSLVFGVMIWPMLFWAGVPLVHLFFLASPVLSLVLSFNILTWSAFFLLLVFLIWKTEKNLIYAGAVLASSLAIGIITPRLWGGLHDYQRNRIITFLDPGRDPFGAGYQVIQSQASIGSGQWFGKGWLQGTQTNLSFLPEQHTDFIFSVLGEQFGFFGVFLVLALFLVLIASVFVATQESHNRFYNLLCVGIGAELCFHIFINTAMTTGLAPVAGIPLPLISYGGSFLITLLIQLGLIINARNR